MNTEYSIKEIRKAFWDTFTKSGEWYFDSSGSNTEEGWDEFCGNLFNPKKEII